jgi:hypothetical protein
VGKIAVIATTALIALGAACLRLSGNAVLFGVGALVLITLCVLALILYIVVARPELAVLEGTELVVYKHMSLGTKGSPPLAIDALPAIAPAESHAALLNPKPEAEEGNS